MVAESYTAVGDAALASARTGARARVDTATFRVRDAAAALVLLIVLAPVFAAIALAVAVDSPGPIFYRARRVGRGEREFAMLKFRKMHRTATGAPLTVADDARLTRVGRILAATRLDELPQLWNVLKGEMSLVGPRPEDPAFVALHPLDYAQVLSVPPGITGLSQLAFAAERDILDHEDPLGDYARRVLPQKIGIDLLYTRSRSFGGDLRIMWWTLVALAFRKPVAVHRGTGRLTVRAPRLTAVPAGPRNGSRPRAPLARADGGRGRTTVTRAVVLAGGRGTRLAPYTSVLPKPLMPIGERSILEIVVEQLRRSGFTEVTFCVGYLSHLIRAVFDAWPQRGVRIDYVHEREPMGTAGPLRLVEGLDDTFLVMNGDVLTTLDYRALVRQHRRHRNVLTIAVHERRIAIDYGVLSVDAASGPAGRVQAFDEKPEHLATVSMGVYAMDPRVLDFIPAHGYFDLPALVRTLLEAGEPVGTYRHPGIWFDIGRQSDYEQAVSAWTEASLPRTAG
jgi:lipopolysaccharide/colanic/teichoic acid biosynthesis glycosyltransferase/dTDP-glucose pyrophosphorylase